MPRAYKVSQSKELQKDGRKKPPKKKVPRKLAEPYPFDEWFDALNAEPTKMIVLTRGTGKDCHFPCRANSMAVQLRTAAANYGIKISIRIQDDDHIVLTRRQVFGA